MEDQASFRAKYDFSGADYAKYHDQYKLSNQTFSLPKTWSVEPGTTDIGHGHIRGQWIFHGLFENKISLFKTTISLYFHLGDRKHLDEAKQNVQDFYKDLLVTIEDTQHK